MPLSPLPVEFYLPSALEVARRLLGARLVRQVGGRRMAGIILETEAYIGESDLACHASKGRTPRTEVMYGPPGRAYVYFIYGMHWMFNVVTGPEGSPAAVLVRTMWPVQGTQWMGNTHPKLSKDWIEGPARLCKALHIDSQLNGAALTDPLSALGIEAGETIPDQAVMSGPRVGINRVPEPWLSKPWRLRVNLSNWQPPEMETE